MALRKYPDSAIAQALCSSLSITAAAASLGMAVTNLESRCRDEGLTELYEKCAARGAKCRGSKRKRRKLPRWGIYWTPPGSRPRWVWGIDAEDEAQALATYEKIRPSFVLAAEVSAAEEIK